MLISAKLGTDPSRFVGTLSSQSTSDVYEYTFSSGYETLTITFKKEGSWDIIQRLRFGPIYSIDLKYPEGQVIRITNLSDIMHPIYERPRE